MTTPSEKVCKSGDDALDELVHFIERFEQRPTLDNLRLVDRYLEGKFHLALQIHDSRFDVNYIAYLQRFDGSAEVGVLNEGQNSTRITAFTDCGAHSPVVEFRRCPVFVPHCCSEQQPMLIDIVQSGELPQTVIPSLVWLERIDTFNSLSRSSLYYSTTLGRHILIEALAKGEVDVLLGCNRRILDHDLIDQMIKSTPEILQDIPSDDGDHGRNFRNRNDLKNMISRLRINLAPQEIGIFFVEGVEFDLQLTDVLIGPFDF